MSGADRFDWNDEESVVVQSTAAIAVYGNPRGNVVIREEGHFHCDEDVWIEIPLDRVHHVVDAMLREAGIAAPGRLALPAPGVFVQVEQKADQVGQVSDPAPTAAAERARRYRERKKRDANVTQRNGVTPTCDAPLMFAAE